MGFDSFFFPSNKKLDNLYDRGKGKLKKKTGRKEERESLCARYLSSGAIFSLTFRH